MMNTTTPNFSQRYHRANVRMASRRGTQGGMSMIELSVVLVVVALISAAVFFGLQSNTRRIETQDNIAALTEISAEIKKKFGRANQYGIMTTALAVQSRAVPEQLRLTSTTAQNSYGGAITIAPATCIAANDCGDITWPSIPQAQCMDVVIGSQAGARRITVGGVVVKALDAQLNIATLATQCEAANTADMVFTVGR